MIGTISFSSTSTKSEEVKHIQTTAQTARLIAEAISRDVRASTGEKAPDGTYLQYPFTLFSNNQKVTSLVLGVASGDALEIARYDPTTQAIVTKKYAVTLNGNGEEIFSVSKNGGVAESLLPTGYSIQGVYFWAVTHELAADRFYPFVKFSFAVVHNESGTSQRISSAVATRELF